MITDEKLHHPLDKLGTEHVVYDPCLQKVWLLPVCCCTVLVEEREAELRRCLPAEATAKDFGCLHTGMQDHWCEQCRCEHFPHWRGACSCVHDMFAVVVGGAATIGIQLPLENP